MNKMLKILKHLFHPQRSNNHRPKLLHPRPLIFMSLLVLGFFQIVSFVSTLNPSKGSVLGYASSITIPQVIAGTNKERTSKGLTALVLNDSLSMAAKSKAEDMFKNQYWAHTSPSGKEPWDFIKSVKYNYKVAGENLARDFDSTKPMVQAWMNSPTHRANIMNPRYEDTGLAVVNGKLNGSETTLVVQMFGTLSAKSEMEVHPSVEVPAVTVKAPLIAIDTATTKISSNSKNILSKYAVPQGSLSPGILMSPLHLLKAFFLSIIFLLVIVLLYDGFVIGHKKTVRLVGKNLAHIILFIFVAYLVIFFKGGVI